MLAMLHTKTKIYIKALQRHVNRLWYPPLIGFLAFLDNFVIVVPTDGILISSSMLTPRRWLLLALSIAGGSTLGALVLAAIVEFHGLPWILNWYPGIVETSTWIWSTKFFDTYGLLLVFAVAMTPFMQQPAVILASLANTPLTKLFAVVFAGRLIKYFVMAYLGSHAPGVLKKLWGLSTELDDAGVKIESS